MASKYNIIVKAVLDTVDLQKQIIDLQKRIKTPINIPVKLGGQGTSQQAIDNQITRWLNKLKILEATNPKIYNSEEMRSYRENVDGLMSSFYRQKTSVDSVSTAVNSLTAEHGRLSKATKNTNKDGYDFIDMIGIAAKKMLLWAVAGTAIYGTQRAIMDAAKYVTELNTELTKLQFVTGQTVDQVYEVAEGYNLMAQSMGVSTMEIAKGSLEWYRQGKTAQEAADLARESIYLAKLGNLDAAQATEYLTSTLNGFKLEASEAGLVVDKLIELDNKYATSAGEISAALQRSSNSAQQAGISFDRLAAYITIVSSITRKSAESIGESFKTIFARMQDVKLGKQFDEAGEDISDVEKTLRRFGIEVRDENLEFKDMGIVLDEVSEKWDKLSTVQQSSIAKAISGVRQRENFITLMNNYEMLGKMLDEQAEAEGLREERFEAHLESVEGHMETMKSTWDSIWMSPGWSEFLKGFYDVLKEMAWTFQRLGGATVGDKETLKNLEARRDALKAAKEEGLSGVVFEPLSLEQLEEYIDSLRYKLDFSDYNGLSPLERQFEQAANGLNNLGETAEEEKQRIAKSMDELELSVSTSIAGLSDTANAMVEVLASYEEYGQINLDEYAQIQKAFPEEYAQALYTEAGQIRINVEELKALVLARAQDAEAAALEAWAAGDYSASLWASYQTVRAFTASLRDGTFWTNALTKARGSASSATKQISDQEKAYNDLLKLTIDMLKQKANDQKDALKDELDGYKKIIDARKDILDQQKEEAAYQDSLAEKNEELSDIEKELLDMQFDNSEAATARKLELADERAKKEKGINKLQLNKSIDDQKDALDKEYDRYKDYIDDKIKVLDQYLSESGSLAQEAMDLLASRSESFYNELIQWNLIYGDGLRETITSAWAKSLESVQTYGSGASGVLAAVGAEVDKVTNKINTMVGAYSGASELDWMKFRSATGTTAPSPNVDRYDYMYETHHSGGIVGGLPKIKESETLALMLKGEGTYNDPQASNFLNRELPKLIASFGGAGAITIAMPITVTGTLDKSVLPELKTMVADTLNKAMKSRGVIRNATSFSV